MSLPASIAVAIEFARALGGVALIPPRVALYLLRKSSIDARIAEDLAADPPLFPAHRAAPTPLAADHNLRLRPLRIFVACAEHSGEIHGANLIDALVQSAAERGMPCPEFHGLGGDALTERGMLSIANPGSRAAMGFDGVLASLPYYLGLLRDARQHFQDWQPDLVLPVDSPALHVPLGRLAKNSGAPGLKVAQFVTPQYWAWAPWRVNAYTSAVDLGLSILPFEPAWYTRHQVPAILVGHPLLDELESQCAKDREAAPEGGALMLLPGSREGVVRRNLPWMLERVAELQGLPEFKNLVVNLPHSRTDLDPIFEELIAASPAKVNRVRGPLHEELAKGSAAFVVSGTVVLDLLPHRLPSVVLYRLKSPTQGWMRRKLLCVPWFTSLNLLANKTVHPEFAFHGDGQADGIASEVTDSLARALSDTAWRAENLSGQELAKQRLGPSGAVLRAADAALDLLVKSHGSNGDSATSADSR